LIACSPANGFCEDQARFKSQVGRRYSQDARWRPKIMINIAHGGRNIAVADIIAAGTF